MSGQNRVREVVSIGIGQMGIQSSTEVWRLYCKEHNIDFNGQALTEFSCVNHEVFFLQNSASRLIPRLLMLDLEPSVCEQIANTDIKNLFDPEKLVYEAESGADVFARGRYSASKNIDGRMIQQIRKTIENCNALRFIHFLNASGGGTGSGLTTRMSQALVDELGFSDLMTFTLHPSMHYQTSPVEYTNALLYMGSTLVDGPMKYGMFFDNEAMYRHIPSNVQATYRHCNMLMAYTISGITARTRFDGDLSCEMMDIETNLIPFKSLNLLIANYAPLSLGKRSATERTVTNAAFNDGEFAGIEPTASQYISCILLYRGNDCSPLKVSESCTVAKQSIEFVQWMPTGFKIGISAFPNVFTKQSVWDTPALSCTKLANHGAMSHMMRRFRECYEPTFDMKAFFHHYLIAGMEEGEFTECMDKTDNVIAQYELAMSDSLQ